MIKAGPDVYTASLPDMQAWAAALMASRQPDVIIGEDYIKRWWVVPRNDQCNVYLHEMIGSDEDRAMHDHPWRNTSFVLYGGYWEITPEGTTWRAAGDVVEREAEQLHRLELPPGKSAISLFMTGPKSREWGFACPKGWVHWKDFTSYELDEKTGQHVSQRSVGCGEFA